MLGGRSYLDLKKAFRWYVSFYVFCTLRFSFRTFRFASVARFVLWIIDYFALHFGVVLHDHTKPCTVLLRAYGNHVNYMRSLPLHQSQQEVHTEGGEYSDFKYFLAPTYDFIMAILGMGSMVEVLEPATLREEMTDWVRDLADMYLYDKS